MFEFFTSVKIMPVSLSSFPSPTQNYSSVGLGKEEIFVFGIGCPREFQKSYFTCVGDRFHAIMKGDKKKII